jgi:tetratricopeptide (TPR) repeat protein
VAPYLSAARFYDVVGKQDQAKSMYRQALALRQDDSDLKTTAARYFLRVNETAEAEALIEEVLKKRSGYLPAMLLKGELLVGKRNWNDAIAVLDQVIAQDDKAGQAYYFKGVALLAKGEFQVAKSSFNRAVELNPNDNRTKLVLVELKLKERDFTGAEKDLKAVLGALPDNYQALLLLGKAFLGQGKLDEAQKSFNRLIELQAQNPEGYYQRGIVWRLQKNGGAAMADFESALALNPKLLDAFGQIVGLLASRKDFTAALARCDQQLHMLKDSSFHQAFIMSVKGRLYMAQDMAKEAESAYQAAILADPNFTQPYYGLAQLYLRRKEVELAIEQYDAMLVKNPNMVGPNMLLGALYDAQKKFDSSEKHYREVLRIDAGFAPAANNLAFLLTERGENLGEALQLAQKAKGKLPEDPSVMDTLGWVYYKRGLYDLAIAEFAGSLEKLPNNASVHYHIGLAYSKKGDTGLAKEHLAKALQLDAAFDGAENARKLLAEM